MRQRKQLFPIGEEFTRNLSRTLRFCYVPTAVLVSGVFLLHFGVGAALAFYSSGLAGAVDNALAPRLMGKADDNRAGKRKVGVVETKKPPRILAGVEAIALGSFHPPAHPELNELGS